MSIRFVNIKKCIYYMQKIFSRFFGGGFGIF